MRIRPMVCAGVLIWSGLTLVGDERLNMELDQRVMTAPGTLRMTVAVARQDVNRSIRIEAESTTYFRSSQIPLDGADAPSRFRVIYTDVPEGRYTIRVELRGTSDILAVARQWAEVHGDDSEPLVPDCDEGTCPP